MSTDIKEALHTAPPLSQVVAEVVGLYRMAILHGINPLNLREYLIPQKPKIDIPESAEIILILVPGFLGPGTSMDWLAKRLTNDKVFAMTWGDHGNIGPFPHIIDPFFDLIKEVSELTGKKVVIVGHSLGGCYALHANRLFPEYVAGAVTLGSPFQTTVEGLAEATVLGRAAALLANDYVQQFLHQGMITDWAPEHTKPDPEGFRLAIAASLDSIVDAFACLLHESENTRNVIVKSDHVGLASNELVARMIDAVVRSGDLHVDFGETINSRLVTAEMLDKINGLSTLDRVLNHMTRDGRYLAKVAGKRRDDAIATGLQLVSNIPNQALNAITKLVADAQRTGQHLLDTPEAVLEALTDLILDPDQATLNAHRGGDVHHKDVPCIVSARDARRGNFPHDTQPIATQPDGRHLYLAS